MIRRHHDNTRHDIYRAALEKFLKNNKTLSLEWVASKMGVRPSTIYNWIQGKGMPTVIQVEKLFIICNYIEEGYSEWKTFLTYKDTITKSEEK